MDTRKKSIEIVEAIDTLLLDRLGQENDEKIQMVKDAARKMSMKMKKDFIQNMCIDLYVSDIKNAETELESHLIKKVSNIWLVYLFREIIRADFKLGDEKVRVQFFEYTKKGYETKEFLNTLMNSVTHLERGVTLNLDSIENILTASDKKEYAKGAKKSVINTLTGVSKSNSFRPHPQAKDRIVAIEDLGKYLKLEDKHKRVQCPVCSEEYDIDKENIDDLVKVKDNVFVFHCLHIRTGNTEDLEKDSFRKDLSSYLKGKHSKRDKQMFVLNNFQRIVGLK